MSEVSEQFKQVKNSDEYQTYVNSAKEKREKIRGGEYHGEEHQQRLVKKMVKRLQKEIDRSRPQGFEMFFFGMHTSTGAVRIGGTKKGTEFVDRFQKKCDLGLQMASYLNVEECSITVTMTENIARQNVQELFNQNFTEYTGEQMRVPYASIESGAVRIKLLGLPDGLTLKKPAQYGLPALQSIVCVGEQLRFTDIPSTSTSSGVVVASSSERLSFRQKT